MVATVQRSARLAQRSAYLERIGEQGDEVREVNATLLLLDRDNLTALKRLADWCWRHKLRDKAVALYGHILELDPKNHVAGERVIRFGKAQWEAESVSQISRFDDAFRAGLGARRRGNDALALVYLQKAESLAQTTKSKIALAAAYRGAGQLETAEAIYRSVLVRTPNDAARIGLAAVLKDLHRYDEAEGLCRYVLRRNPRDEVARRTLLAVDRREDG